LICQLENIGLTSKDIVKVLLLEDEEIEKYNTIYSKLDETQFKIIQELSLEQIQNIEKRDHINEYVKEKCNKLLESMNTESGIKNQPQDKSQLRNMWNALSLWEKKSNADVYFYSNVFYKAMNEVEEKDAVQQYNTFTRLLIQEHQRWMRLHFVHGWEYGEKIKTRRIHDCLCPYIFVDSKNCRYDMFNVMLSKAIVASKPQTSDNNPEPNNTNQENSQGKKQ
ncbi:MAG: hypothetical protein ACI4MY_00920, partial [Christensenellales bacterium]